MGDWLHNWLQAMLEESLPALVIVWGVLLAVWGLLGDAAGTRRRCPKCWYDMTCIPGLTCPECGRVARHEHHLKRARPRRRVMALAVLGVIAPMLVVMNWRRLSTWNWRADTPTQGLVWLVQLSGEPTGRSWAVLRHRLIEAPPRQSQLVPPLAGATARFREAATPHRAVLAGVFLRAIEQNKNMDDPALLIHLLADCAGDVPEDRLRRAAVLLLAHPDWNCVWGAMRVIRSLPKPDQHLEDVLALIDRTTPSNPASYELQAVAETARYLGDRGAADPRVVKALVTLMGDPERSLLMLLRRRGSPADAVLRELAGMGPAASEALPVITGAQGDGRGRDALVEYATLMIRGENGDRAGVLAFMLDQMDPRILEFAASEAHTESPHHGLLARVTRLLQNPWPRVRLAAAGTLLTWNRETAAAVSAVESTFDVAGSPANIVVNMAIEHPALRAMVESRLQQAIRSAGKNSGWAGALLRRLRDGRRIDVWEAD